MEASIEGKWEVLDDVFHILKNTQFICFYYEFLFLSEITVLHVFLSANDVFKKMWIYKICKFDQNVLNSKKIISGESYRISYKGTTKLDRDLKLNWWWWWWLGNWVGWWLTNSFILFLQIGGGRVINW